MGEQKNYTGPELPIVQHESCWWKSRAKLIRESSLTTQRVPWRSSPTDSRSADPLWGIPTLKPSSWHHTVWIAATTLTLLKQRLSATQTAGQQGYLRNRDNKLVLDVILRVATSWRSIMTIIAEIRSVIRKFMYNFQLSVGTSFSKRSSLGLTKNNSVEAYVKRLHNWKCI